MNALLFLLCAVRTLIDAQCIPGLLAGFAMDELGGSVLRDSTVLRQTIQLNSTVFAFSSLDNPQGLSSLVFAGDGQLVLNPFPRPPQYTIMLWFKTKDPGEAALFSWADASMTFTYYARVIGGKVGVAINAIQNVRPSYSLYNDGRWHFVAVAYSQDSSLVTIHLDPHLPTYEVVQTILGTPRAYTVFQIGGMQGRDLGFSGQMDDFRVYDAVRDLSDMQRIIAQVDLPCNIPLLIPQRALIQSAIPANTPSTFALDTTQASVCGVMDMYGRCANNRYGIAVTTCSGTLAGFAAKVVVGNSVVGGVKDTVPSLGTCAVAYDSVSYQNPSRVASSRLCMSAPRVIPFASPSNPISAAVYNQITFTSGNEPLRVEVSVIVADSSDSFNPIAKAFTPQTAIVTCNGNYMEARWTTPILNNGLTCNSCTYQAWYSPLSKVRGEKVNLLTTCGAKLYGRALPDTFSIAFYNQFVLPANVPIPGDSYVWLVMATSAADGVEGVVAVLDSCPMLSPSLAPSMPPTPLPANFTHNDVNSNVLVLNLIPQEFPVGPLRDGFTNQFVTSMATILNTDVPRINVTSFTPTAADRVAIGFDIGRPVPGSDNRTAGMLALLLWNYHQNRTSLLYTVLPNTNPEPASFSSNYESIPRRPTNPVEPPTPYPWELIIIITCAVLGAILLCCLIYCLYARCHRGRDKPRHRTSGVPMEHRTNHNNNGHISGINNHGKPQRFYDDDDKHTSDHINFPHVVSPTRGGHDLATAKRLGSSPDTRTEVSYKGTTINSEEAPHLDPREWKTVIALHGRSASVVAEGDLAFKLNDIIRVIGPCDGPHWFEGELEQGGQRGMVPVNHVKGHTPNNEVRVHRT